ncbi:hypothetical protein Csa_023424 [Cucumis sativus]|uniref:Uncharacterized protein n=1 Tax=Cucumis sativus TaxID=3659 RepID=A0A0A0LII0_CUCSA|nr:hypothetical protein Csa_023424 [Cucumis sativus]
MARVKGLGSRRGEMHDSNNDEVARTRRVAGRERLVSTGSLEADGEGDDENAKIEQLIDLFDAIEDLTT